MYVLIAESFAIILYLQLHKLRRNYLLLRPTFRIVYAFMLSRIELAAIALDFYLEGFDGKQVLQSVTL